MSYSGYLLIPYPVYLPQYPILIFVEGLVYFDEHVELGQVQVGEGILVLRPLDILLHDKLYPVVIQLMP